jgi:hypothetical protein
MVLTPDSEVYLFIDSCQLEATVGYNDLFISFHVLGSIERCCNSYMQLAHLN